MSATCPACSHTCDGRFCSHCGAALEASCRDCGAALPAGGRFCNRCGAAATVAEPSSPAPSRLAWIVAALAVVLAVGLALFPRFQDAEVPTGIPLTATSGSGPASAVDLASMSPREAADRLYNRVMTSVSAGDTASALGFLDMAITAYQQVSPLDADAHYHLALLHGVAGDPEGVRREAEAILALRGTHLFGLGTLLELERSAGNAARARALAERILEVYAAERAAGLREYEEHELAVRAMQDAAREVAR
jgi:hypothetical protein